MSAARIRRLCEANKESVDWAAMRFSMDEVPESKETLARLYSVSARLGLCDEDKVDATGNDREDWRKQKEHRRKNARN